jgi:hypothetical protein
LLTVTTFTLFDIVENYSSAVGPGLDSCLGTLFAKRFAHMFVLEDETNHKQK